MQTGDKRRTSQSAVEIRARVHGFPSWRHRIPLGYGVITPGCEDSNIELARIALPKNLSGLHALDTGCSNELFYFEWERRGAARSGRIHTRDLEKVGVCRPVARYRSPGAQGTVVTGAPRFKSACPSAVKYFCSSVSRKSDDAAPGHGRYKALQQQDHRRPRPLP